MFFCHRVEYNRQGITSRGFFMRVSGSNIFSCSAKKNHEKYKKLVPKYVWNSGCLGLWRVSQLVICNIGVNRRTRRSYINLQHNQHTKLWEVQFIRIIIDFFQHIWDFFGKTNRLKVKNSGNGWFWPLQILDRRWGMILNPS